MDYQVAFYQKSWRTDGIARTEDVVERVLNTRDDALKQLRLSGQQEGKVDHISCGVWLKVRTDRPKPGETTTAFTSVTEIGLHRPLPFSYMPMPLEKAQFRLLELLPGVQGDPLCAQLHVVDLEKAPPFSALSYTWGSTECRGTISLGEHSFATTRITQNLRDALCEIRRQSQSRYLWVDALCIDQDNMNEKNHQVGIMGTIFANAAEVIVYIGEATENSRFGMQTLQFLASGKGFETNPPWETEPPETIQCGLRDILDRAWFHRIWTVQEAALSSQRTIVICSGGLSVEWPATVRSVSMFIRGLKFAAVTAHWRENGLAGSADLGLQGIDLQGIINLLNQQLQQIQRRQGLPAFGSEPDLLDIAYEVKDKRSYDPRDRLYAILGLAFIRGANVQLPVDYSQSLEQVQEDFRKILRDAANSDD